MNCHIFTFTRIFSLNKESVWASSLRNFINTQFRPNLNFSNIRFYNMTFKFFLFIFFTDIDDCVNHTCHNGGSCVDGINSYSCNCATGYTGDYCETGKTFKVLISTWPVVISKNVVHSSTQT